MIILAIYKLNILKMYLLSGSSNQNLAKDVAIITKTQIIERTIHTFTDGEIKITLKNQNLASEHVTILQTISNSNQLIELCFLIDALKASGVKKISLIVPYLFYARQDTPKKGEAFVPSVIIKILENSGINDITYLDLHSNKVQNIFSIPNRELNITPLLTNIITKNCIIVAPDSGAAKRAKNVSAYFGLDLVHIEKNRSEKGKVFSKLEEHKVQNKNCFIIDDIIDSGNTLLETVKVLKNQGASSIKAFCTHGVLSNDHWLNLCDSDLDHLFITNSIDIEAKVKNFDKISIINLSSLISQFLEK